MIIDFDKIGTSVLPNFKGGEKEFAASMYNDAQNRIMRGMLIPGASIGMHTHDTSSEIIFVTAGSGTVLIDGTKEAVRAGSCHYCPKGSSHSLINTGSENLTFLAVVPQQ